MVLCRHAFCGRGCCQSACGTDSGGDLFCYLLNLGAGLFELDDINDLGLYLVKLGVARLFSVNEHWDREPVLDRRLVADVIHGLERGNALLKLRRNADIRHVVAGLYVCRFLDHIGDAHICLCGKSLCRFLRVFGFF